jgi:GNAT superfamily N-acetyltransferase
VRFAIEEVRDLREAWTDIVPLLEGIMEYHRPWDTRTPAEGWTSRIYEVMRTEENVTFLARDEASRAVGFINGLLHKDEGIFVEPFAFVNNAFVKEHARFNGAGTALFQHFEEWARRAGAEDIRLNVNAGNALGVDFWRRAGFEPSEYVLRKSLGVTSK